MCNGYNLSDIAGPLLSYYELDLSMSASWHHFQITHKRLPFICSCCYASLAPMKDMEVTVYGRTLTCPAFARLLHGVLRMLIDQLSVTSFNVAIFNIAASGSDASNGPILAR